MVVRDEGTPSGTQRSVATPFSVSGPKREGFVSTLDPRPPSLAERVPETGVGETRSTSPESSGTVPGLSDHIPQSREVRPLPPRGTGVNHPRTGDPAPRPSRGL